MPKFRPERDARRAWRVTLEWGRFGALEDREPWEHATARRGRVLQPPGRATARHERRRRARATWLRHKLGGSRRRSDPRQAKLLPHTYLCGITG